MFENFPSSLVNRQSKRPGPPFRYSNRDGKVSHLVRGSKVLGDMKDLTRSFKPAAEKGRNLD